MTGSPLDLQAAYTILYNAHERRVSNTKECLCMPEGQKLEAWFRTVLADTLFRMNKLLDEDLVLGAVYAAELLASRRGTEYRAHVYDEASLAVTLAKLVEHNASPVRMLMLGERAFVMYCFLPETRPHRQLRYREYARNFGVRAYGTFGALTDNELGKRMERVFVPLGDIVREQLTPP